MRLLAILAVCLLGTACADRAPVEPHLQVIRTYGWPASVIDPAPDWSPDSTTLVVRSLGGFSLLEDGGKGERTYGAEDRRQTYNPRWISQTSFVFGPASIAVRSAEGLVVPHSDGITQVLLGEGKPQRTQIAGVGYMPKPVRDGRIWIQAEDRIACIFPDGKLGEFGDGFEPEPQPDGPGLCWRDAPAFSPDWWTGRSGPGTMLVRWSPGVVDQFPGAVQAAWTRRGGVVLTIVDRPAADGKPWWSGELHQALVPGRGAAAVTLRRGAHDSAPHPLSELMAWVDGDGAVWMGTIRPEGWSERVAVAGSAPRWSPDGLRLVWTETPAAGQQLPAIRVAVLGRKL